MTLAVTYLPPQYLRLVDLMKGISISMWDLDGYIRRGSLPVPIENGVPGRASRVLTEHAEKLATWLTVAKLVGSEEANAALENIPPYTSQLDLSVGCTNAVVDLVPIRAAVASVIKTAARERKSA